MIAQAETITRDTRSYRQGLVLGLTMAEVFLLLVFALLIALAVLWNSEKKKRKALEEEYHHSTVASAADRDLLNDIKAAVGAAPLDSIKKALGDLRNGHDLEPVTGAEKDFIREIRARQSGAAPEVISDQWRTLTRAAHDIDSLPDSMSVAATVKRVLPDDKDRSRLIRLIQAGLAAEKKGEHDWPPIINLSEANGYFFEKGKAELKPEFETHLRAVIAPLLLERARQYSVTTIEVIGHSDEQKIAPRNSNLDALLFDTVRSNAANVSSLIPADNAGLGLARATAVVQVLGSDERLKGYTLLPLSGGQLIGVDDRLAGGSGGDEPERRRIEIRLRRANVSETPTGTVGPPVTAPTAPPRSPSAPRPQSPPVAPQMRPRDRVVAPQSFPFAMPSSSTPFR
jgi:outer membrane protein OmpA-like peptidoglycan-associated protein